MLSRFHSRQSGPNTCGPYALSVLLQRYHVGLSETAILRRVGARISGAGVALGTLRDICTEIGLQAVIKEVPCDSLASLPVPCLAHVRSDHYVVVQRVEGDSVWVSDPAVGVVLLHEREFVVSWSGAVLWIDHPVHAAFRVPWPAVPSSDRKPLLRLLGLSKPYMSWVLGVAAAVGANAVIGLGLPLAVMYLIDKLLVAHDYSGLVRMTVILSVLAFAQAVIGLISGLLYNTVANAILLDMRARLLNTAQRLSLIDLSRYASGDLLSRLLSDVASIQSFLTSASFGVVVNGLGAIILMVAAIVVNPRLGLIGLAPLPVFVVVYFFSYRRLAEYSRKYQVAQARVTGQAQRVFLGLETIKAYGREDFETAVFDQTGVDTWKAAWKVDVLQHLMTGATIVLASVGPIMVLLVGGADVLVDRITLGALMGINLFVTKAFEPLMALTQHYTNWRTASASADRYFEVMDNPGAVRESAAALPLCQVSGGIRFDEVTVDYGRGTVLKGVSAEFQAGSTVALIGPNGGGKSTLLQLILRHIDPNEGRVYLDGADIKNYRLFSLRAHIGHVTPTPMIFEGTVADNVRYGRMYATEAEVEDVLRIVGLDAFVGEREGLRTPIEHNGSNLSLGQRQRIGLARALLKRPEILVLDEGTNSLDVESEHDILRRVRRTLPNSTIVIVSHRPWITNHVDRVFYIDGGKVVGDGTHQKLVRSCPPYQRLCSVAQMVTGVGASR